MGIPDHFICLLKNLYAGQEVTVITEQRTGSKLGKEYIKAAYCHAAYLYAECIMRNARLNES